MFKFKQNYQERHSNSRLVIVRVVILLLLISIVTFGLALDFPYGHWRKIADKQASYECDVEGIKFICKSGDVFDDHIYYGGGWELPVMHALRDCMLSVAPLNQGVFLDIGACIGTHSLYLSKYSAQVHAVEPFPPALKRLQASIVLNRINNIRVFPVGFSNRESIQPLYGQFGSFDPSFSKDNKRVGNFRLVAGDKYLAEQGIDRVDVIKVDTDGYERLALIGLNNILSKNRPIVVFELNNVDGGFRSKEEILKTFPDAYDFYYLDVNSFKRFRDFYVLKFGSYAYIFGPWVRGKYTLKPFDFCFNEATNILAIPREKSQQFFSQKLKNV